MNIRYSPNRLFFYDPATGRWAPSEHNKHPAWKNIVVCDTFRPDERGISRWVSIAELQRIYPTHADSFGGNGSNFFSSCRKGPITEFSIESRSAGSKIIERRTAGLNHSATQDVSRSIRADILRHIRSQSCAVTGSSSDIECDHRSGRYPPNVDRQTQSVSDFQPLSRCVNAAKRNACKRCIESGSRFDARVLGAPIGWLIGDARSTSCQGCFWHDPRAFFSLIQPPSHS